MTQALTVGAMALTVYLCRTVPLFTLTDPERLPAWVRRWLDYVPPAVLAAMVAPAILVPQGGGSVLRPELGAYALCLVVAIRTRRLFPPLLTGLAGLVIAHFL
ncbi:MAG TPA: AzlD domain-containing protein [Symbiobacteriaceae bacterium]|jgi:branched-subunit amino acid transport protein